jgi:hypothetical protein
MKCKEHAMISRYRHPAAFLMILPARLSAETLGQDVEKQGGLRFQEAALHDQQ